MNSPEPCLRRTDWCRSPVACEGWGYCRERNVDDRGAPDDITVTLRRQDALLRNRAAKAVDEDFGREVPGDVQ